MNAAVEAEQVQAAGVEAAAAPAKPHVPKPVTEYITANLGWGPVADRCHGRIVHSTLKEARDSLAFATFCGCRNVLLRAVTTYEYIGDNLSEFKGDGDA